MRGDSYGDAQAGERRYLSEASMAQLRPNSDTDTSQHSTAASGHRGSNLETDGAQPDDTASLHAHVVMEWIGLPLPVV